MKKYLISELAEEFQTSKTQIRRIIKENNLVAINETTREHQYIAKEYSEQSRLIIRAKQERNNNGTETEHYQNISEQDKNLSNEIIEMLKEDKKRLIKELEELKQDKRDQEQRFHDEKQSFHSLIREEKDRSQLLQIELQESQEYVESKEVPDEENQATKYEDKKSKWYQFWK